MRVLAVVVLVLAASSAALAQPGMTPPSEPGQYGPPPPQPPAPQQYQPYTPYRYQQQPAVADVPRKSSSTATWLSIGVTGLGVLGVIKAFDEESEALLVGGTALAVIGPSAGHIYARENGHAVKMSLLRAGGLAVFTLGVLEHETRTVCDYDYDYDCGSDGSGGGEGEAAMWIGGLVFVGATLYDLYDAGRAATRYNEKARQRANVMFAPTMMSKTGGGVTPGVGVKGSF